MPHYGDFIPGSTIRMDFSTVDIDSVPYTLASGTISLYKDGDTTQSTTGITLLAAFDAMPGANHVSINTAVDGSIYSAGSEFAAYITAGTVNGTSVVGTPIGSFSLNNRVVDVKRYAGTNGTFSGGRPEVNASHVAGAAVNTGVAQLGVNIVGIGGTTVNTALAQIGVNTVGIGGTTVNTGLMQLGVNLVGIGGTTVNTGLMQLGVNTVGIGGVTAATALGSSIIGGVGTIGTNGITAASLATDAGTEVANAILGLTDGIESNITLKGAVRAILSSAAGQLSGATATTALLTNPAGTQTVITAIVDEYGNRSNITLNVGY